MKLFITILTVLIFVALYYLPIYLDLNDTVLFHKITLYGFILSAGGLFIVGVQIFRIHSISVAAKLASTKARDKFIDELSISELNQMIVTINLTHEFIKTKKYDACIIKLGELRQGLQSIKNNTLLEKKINKVRYQKYVTGLGNYVVALQKQSGQEEEIRFDELVTNLDAINTALTDLRSILRFRGN